VTRVAAIVLAAGRSRRMGKFKPLLPFGDQTVIESCVSNLCQASVDEIVVVVGYRAEDVRQKINSLPVTFAFNPNPSSEMSVSIQLGLAAISSGAQAVLITPVDHPAVPSSIIRSLTESWWAGAKLIQPEFQHKGGHPVLVDLAYRHELMNLQDEKGLRGFFEKHRQDILRLPVESPFVARDMDTWDDYLLLHEAVFGHKPIEFTAPDDAND
jgi:CTP:molybdopterin cytidylyltransferase MocA